jgi:hypothetical protein
MSSTRTKLAAVAVVAGLGGLAAVALGSQPDAAPSTAAPAAVRSEAQARTPVVVRGRARSAAATGGVTAAAEDSGAAEGEDAPSHAEREDGGPEHEAGYDD